MAKKATQSPVKSRLPTTPIAVGEILRLLDENPVWYLVMADQTFHSRTAGIASSPKMMAIREFAADLLADTLFDTEHPDAIADEAREKLRRIRIGRY